MSRWGRPANDGASRWRISSQVGHLRNLDWAKYTPSVSSRSFSSDGSLLAQPARFSRFYRAFRRMLDVLVVPAGGFFCSSGSGRLDLSDAAGFFFAVGC